VAETIVTIPLVTNSITLGEMLDGDDDVRHKVEIRGQKSEVSKKRESKSQRSEISKKRRSAEEVRDNKSEIRFH
jgi:hypothetical protein